MFSLGVTNPVLLSWPEIRRCGGYLRGAPFQFGLLASCLLLFVTMLFLPLGLWLTRRKPVPGEPRPLLPRLARGLAWGLSALNIAFLIALAVAAMSLQQAPYGIPGSLKALLVMLLVTSALAAGVALLAIRAWMGRHWSLAGRMHYTLVALAGLAFVWWLNYWNLWGWRFWGLVVVHQYIVPPTCGARAHSILQIVSSWRLFTMVSGVHIM